MHYLCFCKSYFNPIDAQNIAHGEPFMLVQGDFERLEVKERVSCGVQRGAKKQFKRNDKLYGRLADHIGRFPAVMIAPDDAELIQGAVRCGESGWTRSSANTTVRTSMR